MVVVVQTVNRVSLVLFGVRQVTRGHGVREASMLIKRKMVVNGVAVGVETPSRRAGDVEETDMERKKYMQVSYSQALEHWGGSVTAAIWRGLSEQNKSARVSREQFEVLQMKPTEREAAGTISEIIECSRG